MIHAHSGLRWLVLILLILAVFNAFSKIKATSQSNGDKKINLFAMVTYHIQFLIGIALYFTSVKVNHDQGWMKIDIFRFFGMEHVLMMVIAFILITIGHSKSKKSATPNKTIAVFYTIALVLILAGIPWPFREALGGTWF
ncbi:MAG: hypothetical protein M9916_02495 [Crocinitomicaceae bacterium]|nr:hypothetical protein [Crocinitomicaceae bacterium]